MSNHEQEVTRSTYDAVKTHHLRDIIGPRGVRAVRNEYDPVSGRQVSTTDATELEINALPAEQTDDAHTEGQQDHAYDKVAATKVRSTYMPTSRRETIEDATERSA